MLKGIKITLVSVCALLVVSCAVSKRTAFPLMYDNPPISILVLPPMNESTAADAKEYYSTTVTEPLSLTGYYVYPLEVVSDILQNEGLAETEALKNVPPSKFKEFFGADAVMYIKILKWDKVYYVIGGHVVVSVDLQLKSTQSNQILWQYNGTMNVSTSGNSNNGLIASLVETAVKTATTDYVPIAKKANVQALVSIPYGKYHPRHLKDGDDKAVSNTTVDKVSKRDTQP
jgi:hypothetical protein